MNCSANDSRYNHLLYLKSESFVTSLRFESNESLSINRDSNEKCVSKGHCRWSCFSIENVSGELLHTLRFFCFRKYFIEKFSLKDRQWKQKKSVSHERISCDEQKTMRARFSLIMKLLIIQLWRLSKEPRMDVVRLTCIRSSGRSVFSDSISRAYTSG